MSSKGLTSSHRVNAQKKGGELVGILQGTGLSRPKFRKSPNVSQTGHVSNAKRLFVLTRCHRLPKFGASVSQQGDRGDDAGRTADRGGGKHAAKEQRRGLMRSPRRRSACRAATFFQCSTAAHPCFARYPRPLVETVSYQQEHTMHASVSVPHNLQPRNP